MHENALLDKKSQAVVLLAQGQTTDAVGEIVGVDGSTVRRWRKDPGFQLEVSRLRGELLGETVGALVQASHKAVATLEGLLSAESEQVRVRAATGILSAVQLRMTLDMEERLTRIEAAQVEAANLLGAS